MFQSSTAQLTALSELRISLVLALQTMPASDPITTLSVDRLTHHIRLFGKFFRRLQQLDTAKFIELPTCNDMVLYYWSKVVEATIHRSGDMIQGTRKPKRVHRFQLVYSTLDSSAAVYPVRFLVQAMVLFKENLAKWTPFRKGGPITETSTNN